jgi:hypothetical protein
VLGRLAVPAVAVAVVATSGCQVAAPGTTAPRSPARAAASAVDGVWNAHIVWAETPPVGCSVARPGESWADFRMTLSRGLLMIVVSTDLAPQPVVGATSHYRVFRDRISMDDGTSARFERDGDTLTFSDVQGGGCDGRTVMSTVPWRRVGG